VAATPPSSLAGSWPNFRGPNRDNISPENVPLPRSWGPGGPKKLWSVSLGEGYAGAAVAGGKVYVLDYDEQARADTLRAFSLADGHQLWSQSYPANIKRNHGFSRTVPAVAGNHVVTLGPLCDVMCTDANTGKVYWRMNLVQQFGATVPEWYAGQCPLVVGNQVIIALGGKALMVALDLPTGKVVWQTPNPKGWKMTHSSICPVTLAGEPMYVYCASGGVIGVAARDGSLLWDDPSWTVSTANIPTPLPVGDDRIFLCGGYNSGALMLRIKREAGKFASETVFRVAPTTFQSHEHTPVFYNGYLYGVRAPNGDLVCLDLNGKILWTSGTSRYGLGPYLIAQGVIYVLSEKGTLQMVEATPAGFKILSEAKILPGPEAWGPMALVGGRLLARDLTTMVCLDLTKS
jgi:outer membrane protein assembly factor BamB